MEKAFPALVSKRKFRQVAKLLRSRAPESVHPRRASSPYLLSGLVKCETCGKALTAAEAKSGKYTYYVCHSLLKKGKGTCETPRLNSKNFEGLIVSNIRENILTESRSQVALASPGVGARFSPSAASATGCRRQRGGRDGRSRERRDRT